jgi:hypothetical protein
MNARTLKSHARVRSIVLRTLVAFALGMPAVAEAQSTGDVRGAWTADRYLLADGADHAVRGQIFFAEHDWQVLFFVMSEDGEPKRGSGEGGSYERTEDGVVFSHLFNLSVGEAMPGLEEAPLRMVARGPEGAPLEPTRVDVEGDVLTLYFPSGNRMTFWKSSE